MNKRLLAGLMAFCLAAGAANAAFAEDPPLSGPLHTEIATSETAAPAEPTPVPPGPAEAVIVKVTGATGVSPPEAVSLMLSTKTTQPPVFPALVW